MCTSTTLYKHTEDLLAMTFALLPNIKEVLVQWNYLTPKEPPRAVQKREGVFSPTPARSHHTSCTLFISNLELMHKDPSVMSNNTIQLENARFSWQLVGFALFVFPWQARKSKKQTKYYTPVHESVMNAALKLFGDQMMSVTQHEYCISY